jgi:O-antigen/teichoic acid export membrane protein
MTSAVRRFPAALPWRFVRQAGRRLSWGVADQAMSSVSNFAVNIYIARTLGAVQYGAFALAYVTYGFALNASRGLATDPLLVRFSGTDLPTWRRAVAACTGTAAVVGLAAGACVLAAAALLGGTARLAFLALGLTLPALMLQDSWRYSFFALGRGGQAFLNDTIWTVTLLPALVLLRVTGHANVFWLVFAWGAAAAVAAAAGRLQARVVPRLSATRDWLSQNRDLGPRYFAEGTVATVSSQLRNYGIGLILGLAALGYVQAATTLMGPFMVIFFGMGLVLLPEAARILRHSPRHLPWFCVLVSAGLALLGLAWGAVLVVALPRGLGHFMLGSLWRPTYPLVLPSTLAIMGACVSTGAGAGLHALGAAKRSLRAMILTSALYVVGALAGAAAGGAYGTMWGAAIASWIGALVFWWWELSAALHESAPVHGRHRFQSDHPQPSHSGDRPAESLSGSTAMTSVTEGGRNAMPLADKPPPAAGSPLSPPTVQSRLPQAAGPVTGALGAAPSANGNAGTRDEPAEQVRAPAVYPSAGSRPEDLLRRYRQAATVDPRLHALVQTCIDWTRCGFAQPIREQDLLALARHVLAEKRPDLSRRDDEMYGALQRACQPVAAYGKTELLRCHRVADRNRGYEAVDYLVTVDDGQSEYARPVTKATWRRMLDRATHEDALQVGAAAYLRGDISIALAASRRAAEGGLPGAQYALGRLLSTKVNPPDLAEARTCYTRAAEAGHSDAQFNLGVLLATRLDPRDLTEARTWWTRAAEAGHSDAQFNLGVLLATRLDPPDLTEARTWWTRAAEAGDAESQFSLGVLLADLLDPPDLAEAWTWYTRAAEAGHNDAQFNLGVLAERLASSDLAEAGTQWTRAAGAADAEVKFGELANGLDLPDLTEARIRPT